MSRLPQVGLVLLFTGCTTGLYPFNPDGDPGAGDDTGTTEDTGTVPFDTGTDDQGSPPTLTSFQGSMADGEMVVVFGASDPDDDLVGGHLELTVDGSTDQYAIPDDLESWSGSSGTVAVPADAGPCSSATYALSARLVDAEGLRSDQRTDSVTGGGSGGLTTTEVGDARTDVDPLGPIEPPVQICGDIWGASNDGAAYTSDYDMIEVQVPQTGIWTFELTWATTGDDYDLQITDDLSAISPLAYSETDGPAQPEVIADFYVFAGETLYIGVGAWSGSGGPWTIAVH